MDLLVPILTMMFGWWWCWWCLSAFACDGGGDDGVYDGVVGGAVILCRPRP